MVTRTECIFDEQGCHTTQVYRKSVVLSIVGQLIKKPHMILKSEIIIHGGCDVVQPAHDLDFTLTIP